MYDDFFTERCSDQVKTAPEGRENQMIELVPDRSEPEIFADQRDSATENNPARSYQRHRLRRAREAIA